MKILILSMILIISVVAFAATPEEVFYGKCIRCHSSDISLNKADTKSGWQQTIKRMKRHGLRISSGEANSIASYLESLHK